MPTAKLHIAFRAFIRIFLLLAGVSTAARSNALAQTYLFGRADFATGSNPVAVVVADFNGDGKPDLAIVNQNFCASGEGCMPGSVSILLGKADGTFGPKADFAVGTGPVSVTTGDFNGDGKPDLAVLNQNDATVSVLLGNGDGTFQPHVDYRTGGQLPGFPGAVAAADFNGDGKLDLAVGNTQDGTVSVLLGKGDGTFAPHFDYPANAGAPLGLAVGDFNGDGKIDIAVTGTTNNAPTVNILINNGDGTFRQPVGYQTAGLSLSLAAADLNGDGKLDLVSTNEGPNSISILLGNGDGTFQAAVNYSTAGNPYLPAIVDLNGDGKLDLAVPDDVGVAVFLGNGNGTFQPRVDYPVPSVVGAAAGDFNGDGKPDLALLNPLLSTVSVLVGKGDGSFPKSADYATAPGPLTSLITADFNGDGKLDFAVTAGIEVSILLGNGDGTFQPQIDFNTGRRATALAAGDFNGDGRMDLAVAHPADQLVSVFLGNGDGTFQTGVDYPVGGNPNSIIAADFNGDGKLDLAVATTVPGTTAGPVSILLGKGDGTFQNHVDYATGGNPLSLNAGDFNGDGKLDLAIANAGIPTGSVSVLLGNGDGTFQTHVDYPSPRNESPTSITAGDFNGDGKLDLVVNETSQVFGQPLGLSIFLGNGDGTFQAGRGFGQGLDMQSVIAADLNGDGKLDVVAGSGSGVNVFLGNGDGTLQTPVTPVNTHLGGNRAGIVVAGDFNGDGALDLAFESSTASAVTVLLNTPTIALYPAVLTFPGQGVGTSSSPQTVAMSNSGSMAFNVSAIAASGDFAQTNNCLGTLVSRTNCTVSITFSPTATGMRTGAATLTDSVPGSSQVIALSGTGINGPFVILSATSLSFGSQDIGTTSSAQTLMLTNTGNAALALNGITASGDFKQTNTCGSSVNEQTRCTINVTFTPTASGTRTGAITITDNASDSPQSVALRGSGVAVPLASLSPASLSFGSQAVGTTSASQTVTLTNTGSAALAISSITAGPNYTQTNTCGSSLAAAANCTMSVTFAPTSAGSLNGALTITDNGVGSPHVVALSGMGADFSLSVPSGSSSSQAVKAGLTATYTINVTPAGGFNQAVSLTCTGAPSESTCSVSPLSVTLHGSGASMATVTVTTTAPSLTPPHGNLRLPPLGHPILVWFWRLLFWVWGVAVLARGRRIRVALGTVMALVVFWAACGGGGGGAGGGGNPGTPAGTYNLTVTGTFTSGSTTLTHDGKLTLTVQ